MKIWLTMKGLLTVIQVTRLEPTDTNPRTAELTQWTERDQICRVAILSALSNTLFDVYCSDSYTAKSLRDELDRKYNTEEQGLKKYFVPKFMRYQMVEDMFVGIPSSVSLDDSLTSISIPENVEKMSNVEVNPSSTSLTHEEPDEPRRSKTARIVKNFESDFVIYNIKDDPVTSKNNLAYSKAKK
ncbi:hypothetical protein Sango_0026700 [Sesamum angolense]|uniref:Uncharacterized protein n=1 Tax=Sesamum angolense TaxID=2727404 RepID=A0AAE1XCS3_9LAMI|nr:hypothetical protein Sango_0026700 [Sesamum angolense]